MKEGEDKRFLIFGFDTYYPGGGMGDMVDSFGTIPEAIDFINRNSFDCYEVYDRVKGISVDIE